MTEPAEYAELVRRLREYPTRGSQDDAADAIEALQARVESMNRALQAYGDGGIEGPSITGFIDTIGELRARISALEAEARQHALDLQSAEARASGAEARLRATLGVQTELRRLNQEDAHAIERAEAKETK